jgi:FtsH-binding integral membrane protein
MDLALIILAITVVTIFFVLYRQITQPLTEKLYIVNTYLYIFGGLILIALFNTIFDKYNMIEIGTAKNIFIIFILSMLSLCATIMIPRENQVFKHLAWTTFMFSLSLLTYDFYQMGKINGTLWTTLGSVFSILALMSYIAYSYPHDTFDSWGIYLTTALFGLIVAEVIDLLFGGKTIESRIKIYSWIAIVLFSGFLIYDTQQIRKRALILTEMCQNKKQIVCADYPVESLQVILDMVNLFQNISIANNK